MCEKSNCVQCHKAKEEALFVRHGHKATAYAQEGVQHKLENVEHCGGEPEQAATMATHD